jgi:hypothetical protein
LETLNFFELNNFSQEIFNLFLASRSVPFSLFFPSDWLAWELCNCTRLRNTAPGKKKVDYDRNKTWDVHLWREEKEWEGEAICWHLVNYSKMSLPAFNVHPHTCREHFRLWFTQSEGEEENYWIKFPSNVHQRVSTWFFSISTSWELRQMQGVVSWDEIVRDREHFDGNFMTKILKEPQ